MMPLDLSADILALRATYGDIAAVLDPDRLRADIERLEAEASAPDLWDDPETAQQVTSRLSHAQADLKRLTGVSDRLDDLEVLIDMANEAEDEATAAEARAELESIRAVIGELEVQTLLDGEFDPRPAVVTIRAGAGGDDATDFAEMLFRMYVRWAEQHGHRLSVLETSYADHGVKSASFEVDAPYAFGTLSVEAGTHRLVRMSPFNSAGSRETSFAAVEVVPLMEQTESIEVPESDIRVDVYRSSGPGGQSVNTTDSAVRITHLPTNIVVTCQNERSQIQNRARAMQVLQARLDQLEREKADAEAAEGRASQVRTMDRSERIRTYNWPENRISDHRINYKANNLDSVLDGNMDELIAALHKHERQERLEAE